MVVEDLAEASRHLLYACSGATEEARLVAQDTLAELRTMCEESVMESARRGGIPEEQIVGIVEKLRECDYDVSGPKPKPGSMTLGAR